MCLIVFPAGCLAVSLPTRATPDLPHYRTPTTKPRFGNSLSPFLPYPFSGKKIHFVFLHHLSVFFLLFSPPSLLRLPGGGRSSAWAGKVGPGVAGPAAPSGQGSLSKRADAARGLEGSGGRLREPWAGSCWAGLGLPSPLLAAAFLPLPCRAIQPSPAIYESPAEL